jgi:hypothetical protein
MLAVLVLGAVAYWGRDLVVPHDGVPGASPRGSVLESGDQRVERLFESKRSGEMVEVAGQVQTVLADDNEGSRHQRFIMRLPTGRTLLVAHNIDLAPRVPLRKGDRLRVFGEYEWNERGGLLHWTHHDPDGGHAEGWIDFDGTRYR